MRAAAIDAHLPCCVITQMQDEESGVRNVGADSAMLGCELGHFANP